MTGHELKLTLAMVVLFLPLLAAVSIGLGARRWRGLSAGLSLGASAIAFVCSLILFIKFHGAPAALVYPLAAIGGEQWLQLDGFTVDFGLLIDPLSLLMLLIVTTIGTLVQIFSLAYMKTDAGYSRYFAGLSLFLFSMLGIVLASNLLLLFIFWELVGVSSYLLISHWFEKPAAADAGKKAFITNRIGDFGFLLGILLVWQLHGTLDITALAEMGAVGTSAGLLIFCGAVGKSAQFPLHVWLPDAMEGPTPVSALIHAATMVAAGVYMLCKLFFLFTPDALVIISWVGGITALLAALMAVQQNDIKRILAYSTLSQLGYMVMAVGCAGPAASLFHLTTHAAFKALLFLGAGAVIYSCHHEQDIWKLGGLRKKLPLTYRAFVTGALALAGFPLMSGFFSKDAILAKAFVANQPLFYLGVAVALLTAFYMMRCVLVAFHGEARGEAAREAHEAPGEMTGPLIFLSILSIGLGWHFFGLHDFLFNQNIWLGTKITGAVIPNEITQTAHLAAMISGTLASLAGLALGWVAYRGVKQDPLPGMLGALARGMRDKFYFDELYTWLNQWTQERLARYADWFDRWIIAGLGVRGTSGAVDLTGCLLRLVQSGNLQTYALLLALGLLVMLTFFLF
jgi:NADH-quinone oxidoreductase subunit L